MKMRTLRRSDYETDYTAQINKIPNNILLPLTGNIVYNRQLITRFNELIPKDDFNFKSKYTRAYIYYNSQCSLGDGVTISTFINFINFTGSAYNSEKIKADIENNEKCAFKFFSKLFGTAYYPYSLYNEKIVNNYKKAKTILFLNGSYDKKELIRLYKSL